VATIAASITTHTVQTSSSAIRTIKTNCSVKSISARTTVANQTSVTTATTMRSQFISVGTGATIAVQGSSSTTSTTSNCCISTISNDQLSSKRERLQVT
jgi:hypothetical protein